MTRRKTKENIEREARIAMEVIVDAYGPEEQATGWYYYLADGLDFSFTARCHAKRAISPLRVNDEVAVLDIASDAVCEREIFVTIRWERGALAVPLSQLTPVEDATFATRQGVADWHYWVERGYSFS